MNTNHPDPDFDALLAPLFGPDSTAQNLTTQRLTTQRLATQSIAVPVPTEEHAPQPVRAGTAPSIPANWALPAMSESARPTYSRGEPDATYAIVPVASGPVAAGPTGAGPTFDNTDATGTLPSRRSLRTAGAARRGRRAASTPPLARPGTRRMLWVGVGVSAAAALTAGILTTQNRAEDVTAASTLTIDDTPWIDDALSKDLPPQLVDPAPLVVEEEPEAAPQPDQVARTQPYVPAGPPAGSTNPTPSPSPSPSPTPEPTPDPEPEPEPSPEPTESPAP